MQVHIGADIVGIKMVEVFMTMSVGMGIWKSVSSLNNGLMGVIVWGLVVEVGMVWVHIMLLWVEGSVLNIVVLNSVMELSL